MRARKKPATVPQRPSSWDIQTRCRINGRNVEPGTELTFVGQRGRFRFAELVETPTGSWVTCFHVDGSGGARSFDAGKVKTVHTKAKGRTK